MSRQQYFAATTPGLEPACARELESLGITATVDRGGVAFGGGPAQLYAASLHLRTASRILVRLAEFRASAFWQLEKRARRIEWERVLARVPVRVRVTSRRSRLYHESAIAERLLSAIEAATGVGSAEGTEIDAGDAASQLLVVRVQSDTFMISADASGELLHRRGYRQALGRAPVRETLAAAMLLTTGWTGERPVLDPFCGSGTIPIEAALLARRIAPGLATRERTPRAHAFMRWPDFDAELWSRVVDAARERIRPAAPVPILGADRDAGAVAAARANAERAGVEEDIRLRNIALSHLIPPAAGRAGLLATNPPYGERVGRVDPLRNLYAALGNVARERLPGWQIVLLSADRSLERQVGIPLHELLHTRNGGIAVRIVTGEAG